MIPVKTTEEATQILLSGGVGVLPTDTLYGIVARAADPKAVARMYALKQRERKPGTVIAANIQQLVDLGVEEHYLQRVAAWWPSSLSVETPLGPQLDYLHQDTGRQGFRIVPDERVRAILEKTGPLVTSSVNQPGHPPANTIAEAYHYFADQVDFYVDGGNRSGSKPSTIARITGAGIEIIRQGVVVIPPEALSPPHTSQPDCPFCLDNNTLHTPLLYENGHIFVTSPDSAPDSLIIMPKAHVEQLTDLPDDWWQHIKSALQHIPALPDSYNICVNYGRPAGQSVKHLHFWIVPRKDGKPSSGKGMAALIKSADNSAS